MSEYNKIVFVALHLYGGLHDRKKNRGNRSSFLPVPNRCSGWVNRAARPSGPDDGGAERQSR